MFSDVFNGNIREALNSRIAILGLKNLEEKLEALKKTETADVMEALYYMYAFMPLSDIGDYDTEIFLDFARHGAFLYNEGQFAGKVPEGCFAEYVLGYRINNEDISANRKFFYDKVNGLIKGKSMYEAVIELNYWCSAEVTYRTTDERTLSPMTVYKNSYGRCGEESTFAVSVFRSAGIPARQVYVPLWSHCDDNHAWVEVWCDGKWYFLGACEPENSLNMGWFLNASKRAMMVHARCYNPYLEAEINAGGGIPVAVNTLSTYADTKEIRVRVADEAGTARQGVKVHFQVINYGSPSDIATGITDEIGAVTLKTGKGSLIITAADGDSYGEVLADTKESSGFTLRLGKVTETTISGKFAVKAPQISADSSKDVKSKDDADDRKKIEADKRARKEEGLFDKRSAEKTAERYRKEDGEIICSLLSKACQNQKELENFLTDENEIPYEWRVEILRSIREKDLQDTDAATFTEHCLYTDKAAYDKYPAEIFYKYLLCPRVSSEKLRPYRAYLKEKHKDVKLLTITDVRKFYEAFDSSLKEEPEMEYKSLISTAYGAFLTGYAGEKSKRVIFIQILRSLGIPARLNPVDGKMEAMFDGEFVAVKEEELKKKGVLKLDFDKAVPWSYCENFSLMRFENGEYRLLDINLGEVKKSGGLAELEKGIYRLITANRLPNGNIFAKSDIIEVKEGETVEAGVSLYEAKIEDMLSDYPVRDIMFTEENGERTGLKALSAEKGGIFIWLDKKSEPTEHILNELYDKRELFNALKTKLYLVVKEAEDLEDANISRVSEALSNRELLFEDFGAEAGKLARELYLEPASYPLICVINREGTGTYGTAGYNVGTADMLLKICRYLEEK